jgi:hypothetical protein
VFDTLFPAHAQRFDSCREKNVLKLVNYCEGGEIENKYRKKERQNERKGELNNESEKRVLLNKTML